MGMGYNKKSMAKSSFVHLHVHSHYSLLDGLGKVSDLVTRTVELGMPALALTDHGVLYGAIDFFLECKKAGIKPIIGQEAYVAPRGRTDKSSGIDTKPYHLVLLAKNEIGYKNLIKLTSLAHMEGYYYKPRIDRELLSRHSEGLIASSACLASETSRLILDKNWDGLDTTIREYQEIFGKDNYYLELQHHPSIAEQQVVNQHIKDYAKKNGLPLIVTNDAHYVNSDDNVAHDMLVCIQTGKLVSDTNRMLYTGDFSLKSPDEMAAAFTDVPEALDNTIKIADMVDFELKLDQSLLPAFPLPKGETEGSLLKKWCEKGLQERYAKVTPAIRERLDYELATVMKTGYPGYFLIVADMINFAKSQGIYVGPGRGSAAGSLIAYVTGITNIDPLQYNLLFERFLDLNRISMPDIDMDFEDTRRHEVVNYLREKYGEDHVAGIITFGTIMARAAVRDVGRVLGVPYANVDAIAKVVPAPIQGRHVPLSKSVEDSPELKAVYQNNPEAKQIIDGAIKLEGTIRHASQHACAIVIAKESLDQYAPVQPAQGGDIHQITQYSMGPIEKIGLLKMDLLGLANLTTMHQATDIIEAVYGQKIDIYNLPLDDAKTFALLGRGETTGVFQLESSGMKRYIRELKPSRFEDIIAMVSLYRPGPMQWIQSFIDRKNHREEISYLHPLAETALKETYGIPVYQEQVMQLSKDMCGFTGSEADTLRKAMGKKIPKLMKEMKVKFIDGALTKGVTKAKAEEIFRQLEDFAAYAFNKSHATCYALISYQTAYLKAHYPDCFMAALMTSDLNDIDRISIEISECERIGLTVLPPDVNESFSDFAVVKDAKSIRFGLSAIKNVGSNVAKAIVVERKNNGAYQNLEDFLQRSGEVLNKKVLESLVKSGALDRFSPRASLYAGLELLVKFAGELGRRNGADQMSIFGAEGHKTGLPQLILPAGTEDRKLQLTWEKELLGLYLSDHPLKEYVDQLKDIVTPINELRLDQNGQVVRVGGIIHEVKKITTRSNQMMAFVQLEDLTGMVELLAFPTIYKEKNALMAADRVVVAEGKVSDKDGSIKILLDTIIPLEEVRADRLRPLSEQPQTTRSFPKRNTSETPAAKSPETYVIELPKNFSKTSLESLKTTLQEHPGKTPVELHIMNGNAVKAARTKLQVQPSAKLEEAVQKILG